MFSLPIEMRVRYLQRRNCDLEIIKRAIFNNSIEEINTIGHQWMGNARSFGFESLESIAYELENIELENLSKQGPRLIQDFSDWLKINSKLN